MTPVLLCVFSLIFCSFAVYLLILILIVKSNDRKVITPKINLQPRLASQVYTTFVGLDLILSLRVCLTLIVSSEDLIVADRVKKKNTCENQTNEKIVFPNCMKMTKSM